jgi:hypothetical protein
MQRLRIELTRDLNRWLRGNWQLWLAMGSLSWTHDISLDALLTSRISHLGASPFAQPARQTRLDWPHLILSQRCTEMQRRFVGNWGCNNHRLGKSDGLHLDGSNDQRPAIFPTS